MPGGWEDETNKLKALQELADNVGDAFEDAAAAADEALKYIMGFVKEGVEFQAARIVPVPVQLVAVAECAWARTGDGDAAGEDEGGKRECGVFVGVKGRGLDAVKKEERETMGLLKKEEIETVERARVWLREQAADKGASGKAIGWMGVYATFGKRWEVLTFEGISWFRAHWGRDSSADCGTYCCWNVGWYGLWSVSTK